ncbi:hypothetical protein KJ673_00055 [Patescibacteria group bacterium]|nr:hypothetical protein [Patescibacteria group bacterium]
MHHSHITWFPFILIGLTFGLVVLVFAFFQGNNQSHYLEPIPLTQEEYQSQVISYLDVYSQDEDAQAVYDSLLAMHIPEVEKQAHLDLVLLFGKIVHGEIEDPQKAITDLKLVYPWTVSIIE